MGDAHADGVFYGGEFVQVNGRRRFGNAVIAGTGTPAEHAVDYPDGPEEYARNMDLDPDIVRGAVQEYEANWDDIVRAECRARDWAAGFWYGLRYRERAAFDGHPTPDLRIRELERENARMKILLNEAHTFIRWCSWKHTEGSPESTAQAHEEMERWVGEVVEVVGW